jgi:hypothetical protein
LPVVFEVEYLEDLKKEDAIRGLIAKLAVKEYKSVMFLILPVFGPVHCRKLS